MKAGKINWDDLKRIIYNNRGKERSEVRIGGGVGEDCAVVNFGDYECVISTDPITAATNNIGRLAVNINCNDIASSGVEPLAIMVTILAPEEATIDDLEMVMKEISEECKKLNVAIIGGHTEITKAVNQMIVSCTVLGRTLANKAVLTKGACLGDDIVVSKYIALEGTSILANDFQEKAKLFLTPEELLKAKALTDNLSVVKEGKIAGEFGVSSMHDITEGGILGALWEMAEASELGFEVYEDKMPILDISKKLCEGFKIDPLKFISSGSMLITTSDGEGLVKVLKDNKINASIIGKVTEEKGVLISNGIKKEVLPPQRDELFNI